MDYQDLKNYSKIKEFIKLKKEEFMTDIKKAVTSEAGTIDNTPKDEATASGENKPAIQEAITPAELAAQVPEVVQVETPAELDTPKKTLNFDGLFANDFSLGATLRQDPSVGHNVLDNMKKPAIDYVDRAKNHKNEKLTSEDFKNKK